MKKPRKITPLEIHTKWYDLKERLTGYCGDLNENEMQHLNGTNTEAVAIHPMRYLLTIDHSICPVRHLAERIAKEVLVKS